MEVLLEDLREFFEEFDEVQDGNFDKNEIFRFYSFIQVVMLDVVEFEHSFFRDVLEVFAVVWRGVHEILFFKLLFCIIPAPVRQQRCELFNSIKLLDDNNTQINKLFVVVFEDVFAEIVVEIVDDVL